MGQYDYEFLVSEQFNKNRLKSDYDITITDVEDYGRALGRPDSVHMPLTPATAMKVGKFGNVKIMTCQNKPRGFYNKADGWPIFPNDPRYNWSEDNFGPLWVPKKGATIHLTDLNLPLYRRAIAVYEHNTVEEKDGAIWINGKQTDSYTFQQDYYWMMGDNRHRSQDARFWGFVPFDHIVGKAELVWLTADPEKGGFPMGIRWKRLFSWVK